MARKSQHGPIEIQGKIDRIYLDTSDTCTIHDPGLGRVVHVEKHGSQSTVVWNPWIEGSQRMADLDNEAYIGFVCIETAKAADDVATVLAGGEHRFRTEIWLGRPST